MTAAPTYQFGKDTPVISLRIHQKARARLVEKMPDKSGVVLLKGGDLQFRYDTDAEYEFRQESFFHYLFAAEEASCFGSVELDTGRAVLFVPRLPSSYAVWMGEIYSCEHYKEKYAIDKVLYVDELPKYMESYKDQTVYVLSGVNLDSSNKSTPATFEGSEAYNINTDVLHPVLSECRSIKFEEELEVLRAVCEITCQAHKAVMRMAKPGVSEFQLESTFLHEVYYRGGCRFHAYTCICGAGHSGSILHNMRNRTEIKDNDMILVDMGAEYYCYSSDVSCSYPATGKFSEKQKAVYNAVLKANRAVLSQIKAGVYWPDMHRLSERVLLEGLKEAGLVKGNVDDMMKCYLANVFYPHGLGHLMGLDVHDCGGYIPGTGRSQEPGLRSLRCGRLLEENMVLTVEPGCYFIEPLILPALSDPVQSQFLVEDKVREYLGFGGVRIEDDVVITKDGYELLSKVPRTVEEIEALMDEPYVSPITN